MFLAYPYYGKTDIFPNFRYARNRTYGDKILSYFYKFGPNFTRTTGNKFLRNFSFRLFLHYIQHLGRGGPAQTPRNTFELNLC